MGRSQANLRMLAGSPGRQGAVLGKYPGKNGNGPSYSSTPFAFYHVNLTYLQKGQ